MNEEIKTLLLYLVSAFAGLLTAIGGWVFKKIFNEISELDIRQAKHEQRVQKEFSEIQKELAINSERDNKNYESIMIVLHNMQSSQEKLMSQMDTWQKNIENFYYLNPTLKKPDL